MLRIYANKDFRRKNDEYHAQTKKKLCPKSPTVTGFDDGNGSAIKLSCLDTFNRNWTSQKTPQEFRKLRLRFSFGVVEFLREYCSSSQEVRMVADFRDDFRIARSNCKFC